MSHPCHYNREFQYILTHSRDRIDGLKMSVICRKPGLGDTGAGERQTEMIAHLQSSLDIP